MPRILKPFKPLKPETSSSESAALAKYGEVIEKVPSKGRFVGAAVAAVAAATELARKKPDATTLQMATTSSSLKFCAREPARELFLQVNVSSSCGSRSETVVMEVRERGATGFFGMISWFFFFFLVSFNPAGFLHLLRDTIYG